MKLLVANRAEIACRIFQTCREMGITTVGIFTAADDQARHVTYAEEVYEVSSYLNIDEIVKVAKEAGVDLIHPGYGFLSERAPFVEAVEKAGMIFVGPSADSMRALGGKIEAKRVAEAAQVPTLPWVLSSSADFQELKTKVSSWEPPFLLKAASGGGGKGMRVVRDHADFEESFRAASSEALSSFGDATVFVEKLLDTPRHIEIQVFGDGRGSGVHFFERECTLQRRHQKVWEEAPSVSLHPKTREALCAAALRLVSETRYRNAGTCEFLLVEDEKKNQSFYFLEMNTRLQVEHPVTEQVTGVDLVRLQIDLALNPKLVLQQVEQTRGHSIEVRLYAEDPENEFMPTPGKVNYVRWPSGTGIRVESGIESGQDFGVQFDPMMAKLIVTASTRDNAIARMKDALNETVILGSIGSNQKFLRALCDDEHVLSNKIHTNYLERCSDSEGWRKSITADESVKQNLQQLIEQTSDIQTGETTNGRKDQLYANPFIIGERR